MRRELLSDSQRRDLYDSFEIFDADGTGRVDPHEMLLCMVAAGMESYRPEVPALAERLSVLPRGKLIDFTEFLDIVLEVFRTRDQTVEVDKAFAKYDDDGTGKISFRNLRRVALELGEDLTDEEIQYMLSCADTDGDGEISRAEFGALLGKEDDEW